MIESSNRPQPSQNRRECFTVAFTTHHEALAEYIMLAVIDARLEYETSRHIEIPATLLCRFAGSESVTRWQKGV